MSKATVHKPSIRRAIIANRKNGESRNAQAKRLGIPEPTIRKAEKRDRRPDGAAGTLLDQALGLTEAK